jgi:hypothetical protein
MTSQVIDSVPALRHGVAMTDSAIHSPAVPPLRLVLGVDAAVTAADGAAYLLAAGRSATSPTTAGSVWIVLQGLAVGALAGAQALTLRG